MHTPLGSSGSAATGTAAALRALMRKGKIKEEPINVIAFCGDGGGADMGVSSISAALMHTRYNLLIICYDNESYANTDIQISGAAFYQDRYQKRNGTWLIEHTGYDRVFEQIESRSDRPSLKLTASMWTV